MGRLQGFWGWYKGFVRGPCSGVSKKTLGDVFWEESVYESCSIFSVSGFEFRASDELRRWAASFDFLRSCFFDLIGGLYRMFIVLLKGFDGFRWDADGLSGLFCAHPKPFTQARKHYGFSVSPCRTNI